MSFENIVLSSSVCFLEQEDNTNESSRYYGTYGY
jgi:hypothetical protein